MNGFDCRIFTFNYSCFAEIYLPGLDIDDPKVEPIKSNYFNTYGQAMRFLENETRQST